MTKPFLTSAMDTFLGGPGFGPIYKAKSNKNNNNYYNYRAHDNNWQTAQSH